jgi:hypothetical protein
VAGRVLDRRVIVASGRLGGDVQDAVAWPQDKRTAKL